MANANGSAEEEDAFSITYLPGQDVDDVVNDECGSCFGVTRGTMKIRFQSSLGLEICTIR